jgi:hypothetical protein
MQRHGVFEQHVGVASLGLQRQEATFQAAKRDHRESWSRRLRPGCQANTQTIERLIHEQWKGWSGSTAIGVSTGIDFILEDPPDQRRLLVAQFPGESRRIPASAKAGSSSWRKQFVLLLHHQAGAG